jgi:hypothetical protein
VSLQPRAGFEWSLISWGAPDQTQTLICSYCEAPLDDDSVPLMLFNQDGWAAEFCAACQAKWWGITVFAEPEDDD